MNEPTFDKLDQQENPRITCYKCKSTNWTCYNERSVMCWDHQGNHCGDMVIGSLKCKDCGACWEDVSVDCQEADCTPEDDD
jgi:hypothetical protein